MASISIEIRYSDRRAELREFQGPKVVIGREQGDLVLGDPSCSGRHAEINIVGTQVTYVDLNSTNGSYGVDGQRLTAPTSLSPGSEIRIGGCTLVLRSVDGSGGQVRYGAKGTELMEIPVAGVQPKAPESPSWAPVANPPAQAGAADIAFDDTVNPSGVVSPFQRDGAPGPGLSPGAPAGGAPGAAQGGPQYGSPPPVGPGGAPPDIPPGVASGAGQGAPQYGAPPGAPGQPGMPGGAPQYGAPPGAPGQPGMPPGANPYAAPIVAAGAQVDPVAFLSAALNDYKPHVLEATKVIGFIAVPLGLLNAVASFIPIPLVGGALSLLGGLGFYIVYACVGFGAQAEFALRLATGVPVAAEQAWKIQLKRAAPWLFGILVPAIVTSVGLAFCIIPGILIGFFFAQVYMVEKDKSMIDINKRCFELVMKEGLMVVVLCGVFFVVAVTNIIVALVLGFVPVVGAALAAVWGPVFMAVATPFTTFLVFRLYFDARHRSEGIDALGLARGQLDPL